jgi:hypothetical protein
MRVLRVARDEDPARNDIPYLTVEMTPAIR